MLIMYLNKVEFIFFIMFFKLNLEFVFVISFVKIVRWYFYGFRDLSFLSFLNIVVFRSVFVYLVVLNYLGSFC